MAQDNKTAEEVKETIAETKKLDEKKEMVEAKEDKRSIVASEEKAIEESMTPNDVPAEESEDKTATAKEIAKDIEEKVAAPKEEKKVETKVELEREYIIPLRREVLKTKRYRRAKRAVRAVKEFLAKHMKVEGRDIKKVKISIHLNNEIWFRGIKKPMNKVKVKAVKKDGVVYAELAEIPEVIQYKISREIKRAAKVKKAPKKKLEEKVKESDANKDSVDDKKEKAEKAKAGAEKEAKIEKAATKAQKHTAKGAHAAKKMPVQKKLKS